MASYRQEERRTLLSASSLGLSLCKRLRWLTIVRSDLRWFAQSDAGTPARTALEKPQSTAHRALNGSQPPASRHLLSAQMSSSSLFITSCIWLDW
jgi:hypothetical protein